jgi:hypothetical protein
MQTTGKPAPRRDYIAEIQACKTLEDLCRLYEDLLDVVKARGEDWTRAAMYKALVTEQINYLARRGFFLSPARDYVAQPTPPSPTDHTNQ